MVIDVQHNNKVYKKHVFDVFNKQGTLNFFSTHTYDDKNTHQYDSYSPFKVSDLLYKF